MNNTQLEINMDFEKLRKELKNREREDRRVNLSVKPSTYTWLEDVAKELNVSVNKLINLALECVISNSNMVPGENDVVEVIAGQRKQGTLMSDIKGNFLKRFESRRAAGKAVAPIGATNKEIRNYGDNVSKASRGAGPSHCSHGTRETALHMFEGFVFWDEENFDQDEFDEVIRKINAKGKTPRAVKLSINGSRPRYFSSITKAAEKTGVRASLIKIAIEQCVEIPKGYVWEDVKPKKYKAGEQ